MIKSILIVCIGNICRSPMAAGLLSAKMPSVAVDSAGISAVIGHRADPIAAELVQERGIDITGHIAKQLTPSLCQKADLIFVMDREQRNYLEARYPLTRGKVFRLAEGQKMDIPDPYRLERSAFENALHLIEGGVLNWSERIGKINEKELQTK